MNILNKQIFTKYYIPIGLLVLNFILKVAFLDSTSIAGDEPFSIYHAQMDVSSIVTQLCQGNNPPLFEILLHFWIKIFGISAFATRFLPLLFSVVTVYFIYKIGISFFDEKIAIVSSLIFSFADYHILYAHETRVYTLFALLTTVSMFAFLNLIKNSKSKPFLILLIITNALLCYSHYFALFIPFIQLFCSVVFTDIRNKILKVNIIAILGLIILYIPNIKVLITRFLLSSGGTWVEPAVFEDLYTMLWRFSNAPVTTVIFLAILLIALLKVIIKKAENVSSYNKVILVWFLLPYLLMFLVSLKYFSHHIPIFMDRYVIFISIGFYLTIAIAINYISSNLKYNTYLLLLPIILMMVTVKLNVDNKRNVRETVSKVKELKTSNTIVYFCPDWFDMNFVYYYNIEYFKDYDNVNIKSKMYKHLESEKIFPINNQNQIDTNLIKTADRVIYLDAASDFSFPNNNIFANLASRYSKQQTFKYPQIFNIYVFEK